MTGDKDGELGMLRILQARRSGIEAARSRDESTPNRKCLKSSWLVGQRTDLSIAIRAALLLLTLLLAGDLEPRRSEGVRAGLGWPLEAP